MFFPNMLGPSQCMQKINKQINNNNNNNKNCQLNYSKQQREQAQLVDRF